jgi:hypothetical protein
MPEKNRPLLLKIAPVFLFLWGGAVLIARLAAVSGIVFTSRIEGKVVASNESVPAILRIVLAVAALAAGLAILLELPWSRPLMIVCLILAAGGQLWSGAWETFPLTVPALLFGCWYLYSKSNVRAYYRDLKASRGREPVPEQRPDPI